MRALSIRQPWAWLIVRPDIADPLARQEAYRLGLIKDVENRTWQTKMRGRFAVQASLSIKRAAYDELADEIAERRGIIVPGFREIRELTGGIIGTANLVDCVRQHESRWKERGQFGFVLAEAKPVDFIPYLGRLNFFDLRRQDAIDAIGESDGDMVVNPMVLENRGGRISQRHHNTNTQQRGPHLHYASLTQQHTPPNNPTHRTEDAKAHST